MKVVPMCYRYTQQFVLLAGLCRFRRLDSEFQRFDILMTIGMAVCASLQLHHTIF